MIPPADDPSLWPEMVGIALSAAALVGTWLRWLLAGNEKQIAALRDELRLMDNRLRIREARGVDRDELTSIRVELTAQFKGLNDRIDRLLERLEHKD